MLLNEKTKPVLSLTAQRIKEHPNDPAFQNEMILHAASLLDCDTYDIIDSLTKLEPTLPTTKQRLVLERAWNTFIKELPEHFREFTPLYTHKETLLNETLSRTDFLSEFSEHREDEIEWVRCLFVAIAKRHTEWHRYDKKEQTVRFQNENLYVNVPCIVNPLTHNIQPDGLLMRRHTGSITVHPQHLIPPNLMQTILIGNNCVYTKRPEKSIPAPNFYWFDTSRIEPEPQDFYFELVAYDKDNDRYDTLAKSTSLEKLLTMGRFYTETMVINDLLRTRDDEPIDWLLLDYHKPGSFETLGHFNTKHPTTFVIAT